MFKIILTFDLEDFINTRSIRSLNYILELLKKYNLRGIFFITGNQAEKIQDHPHIVLKLKKHEIGFHSSSHSIGPEIAEYCDVKSYKEAVNISVLRETNKIDINTGKIKGRGGIHTLKKIFPNKKIYSHRAPNFIWTPSHLEALKKIGIPFTFSTHIKKEPFNYKEITFYPPPIELNNTYFKLASTKFLFPLSFIAIPFIFLYMILRLINNKFLVTLSHPCWYVNKLWWHTGLRIDSSEKKVLHKVAGFSPSQIEKNFLIFEIILFGIKILERCSFISVTNKLIESTQLLNPQKINVINIYKSIISRGEYRPKYLLNQFTTFFNTST